jgi:hypothetical protein
MFSHFKGKGVVESSREHNPSTDSDIQLQRDQNRDPSTDTNETAQTQQDDREKATTISPRATSEQEGQIENENVVKYNTMNWWHCGVLMIAECISLGVLSLPHAMAVLGLVRLISI